MDWPSGLPRLVACARLGDSEGMSTIHNFDAGEPRVPESVVPAPLFLNELCLRGFRFQRWNFRA
jgi:hypothetical protein